MGKAYRTIDEVWTSPWASMTAGNSNKGTDRVLRSSRLEDSIFMDCREGDTALD